MKLFNKPQGGKKSLAFFCLADAEADICSEGQRYEYKFEQEGGRLEMNS